MLLDINEREFAHILIGLRILQKLDPDVLERERERFTQIQGHEPMTAEEIDILCEELNRSGCGYTPVLGGHASKGTG